MKKRLCIFLSILTGLAFMGIALGALAEGMTGNCPDLAVCGGLVCHISGETMLCEDVETRAITSSLPLSGLYEAGERLIYASVTSWAEGSVMLTLGLQNADNTPAVRLLELAPAGDAIGVVKTHDATGPLGFLFDASAEWYEVNTAGCRKGLYIAALNADYLFHLYLYAPDTGELLPLGERPLDSYIAAVPCDGDMLIAGPDPMDDGLLELDRLSLEDGSVRPLDAVRMDSALRASNFAWDESRQRLCYTVNNTVYALSPDSGEAPQAVGTFSAMPAQLRLGAISGSRFVALDDSGELLCCDLRGDAAPSAQLRVANIAGDEAVIDASRDFGITHPGCSVSIADAVDEADALSDAGNHSPNYDLYVLILDSELYRDFLESGFLADLSANAALSAAANDMTPRMASAIQAGGHLAAMPVAVGNYCQLLNVPAMQALTGLSREELPTDWPGFLALLGQLADSGALTGEGGCRLYDADMSADDLRALLLSWMVQDCRLWMQAEDSAAERLPQAVLPALEAFNGIDWSRLAASDGNASLGSSFSASEGIQFEGGDSGREALLSDGMLDIVVSLQAEDTELWPLSVQPGGERLIGQVAAVICVNPYSANPEAALAFAAHAWEKTNVETKMALCQSMNAPTANAAYRDDLAYMAEDVEMLRRSIDAAQSDGERDYLQTELDRLLAYMEDYRSNGRWTTSEESISRYRAWADALIPVGPDLGSDGLLEDLMEQFLEGTIAPAQFADRLAEALK